VLTGVSDPLTDRASVIQTDAVTLHARLSRMSDSSKNKSKTASDSAPDSEAPAGPPVRPRDAASLILYRPIVAGGIEVLLGRRPGTAKFMPDVYVYPGGAVDLSDARARPATDLNPAMTDRMAVSNSVARARTMAMAAVRETFEETGLLVTVPGSPGNISDETWQRMDELGMAPDLERLNYIGRAITPTMRPRRFHARFFAVDASEVEGTLEGNGELIDLAWVRSDRTDDLAMRHVARHMLAETEAMLASADPDWIGDSMFTQRFGKLHVSRQS